MNVVGSSTDRRTSKRRLPGSRTEASWLARVASRKASRCSGFTWTWTRVTYIGGLLDRCYPAGPRAAASGEARVVGRRALHEPAVALRSRERALPHDDRAAAEDDVGPALDLATLVAAVVAV